ncbi:MAG TPA: hypothetical protein DCG12_00165 [Planctomycetaceae bacterium]|nr:hypothetical protein [Planctomycetaceae bacterium]
MSSDSTEAYTDEEFLNLTQQLRDGSAEAFQEVLEHFGPYVLRAVRRNLDRRLRSRFDSQDFAQAVWMTIHENRSRLAECESPDSMIALLVVIAQRKVRREFRKHLQAEKQNINREQSLHKDSFVLPLPDHSAERPSQVVMAREQWEAMTANEPEKYRQIAQLRCDGLTLAEIAEEVGVNERTVRRVIQRLAEKLED